MAKIFKNVVVKGYDGKPIVINLEEGKKELTVVMAMRAVLNNAPLKTQQDSINGARLATALDEADDNGEIAIEEGTHDWLKPIAEQLTPQIFRVNGHIIYELIKEGFEKAVKKSPEKGKVAETKG